MSQAARVKITEKDITGLKDFDQLAPLLQRLHTHFEILRGIPTRVDVTPNGGGEYDERAVLESAIEADRLYGTDRGYAKFLFFNKIVAAGSSYVCRLRDNSVWTTLEERCRNDEAGLDEIISDEIVTFSRSSASRQPDHKMRIICLRVNPHTTRGKYRGGSSGVDSDGILRIATNLLDVPADVIARIFFHRWAIEIFFRFFKHMLGCRHLLSHNQNGIEFQTYCAMIACLLIALWTGRQPTKRTYEMICFYFCGLADADELMAHIEKLKNRRHNSQGVSPSCLPSFTLRRLPQRIGSTIDAVLLANPARHIASRKFYKKTTTAITVPNTIGTVQFAT